MIELGMKMGKGVDLVLWPPAASLLSSFKLLHWETSLQVCNVLLKIDQSLKQKILNFHQYPGCELFFGMNVWKLLNPLIQDFIRAPSHPHCGSIKVVLKQNAKFIEDQQSSKMLIFFCQICQNLASRSDAVFWSIYRYLSSAST